MFAVLFGNEGIATVWAAKFYGGKPAVLWREACSADFAEDLAFGTVVFIEVRFGGIASGAGAVIRDVTIGAPGDGTDLLAITFFVVRDEVFVIPVLPEVGDQRKLVDLELLVFWRV